MKVKDLCDINIRSIDSNIEFETYEYLDTGNITQNVIDTIQVFNSKDCLPSRAKRLVNSGDIIISTVRPIQKHYGYLKNPKGNLVVSTGFTVLTPKKDLSTGKYFVNGQYLYYYLTQEKLTNYFQMIAESSVSSYPSITSDIIGNIDIDLPLESVQDEVAEVLDSLESKYQINIDIISELEEYTQLMFHKWFVDFNFPGKDGKSYKDNGGEMIELNEKMIPKGWTIKELNSMIGKSTDSIAPSDTPNYEYKYYSIPVYDETKTYSLEKGSTIGSDKYKVSYRNLLVSKLNPWFNRVVYPLEIENAICSTEFVVWIPKIENILEYLYVVANTPRFTKYCTLASTGTSNSHKRVNPDYMMKYLVPFNKNKIIEFNELIKPMIIKIHYLISQNQMIRETRDSIIKKLID